MEGREWRWRDVKEQRTTAFVACQCEKTNDWHGGKGGREEGKEGMEWGREV